MRFIAICFMLLSVPAVSAAQDTLTQPEIVRRAQDLYASGVAAYNGNRWLECAEKFEGSFVLVFSPDLLYNIGQCYNRASAVSHNRDHYRRAIAAYSRYLRERPGVEDAEETRLTIRRLRAEMALTPSDLPPPLPPEDTPEPEPTVTPTVPEVFIVPEPEVHPIQVPVEDPEDPEFAWKWTVTGAAATAATAIVSLAAGIRAQREFRDLQNTCGATTQGCNPTDTTRVSSLVTTTNLMLAFSGVLLAGTGVAFALEFKNQNGGSPTPSALGTSYTRSF